MSVGIFTYDPKEMAFDSNSISFCKFGKLCFRPSLSPLISPSVSEWEILILIYWQLTKDKSFKTLLATEP